MDTERERRQRENGSKRKTKGHTKRRTHKETDKERTEKEREGWWSSSLLLIAYAELTS